jgi:hypothetical protein
MDGRSLSEAKNACTTRLRAAKERRMSIISDALQVVVREKDKKPEDPKKPGMFEIRDALGTVIWNEARRPKVLEVLLTLVLAAREKVRLLKSIDSNLDGIYSEVANQHDTAAPLADLAKQVDVLSSSVATLSESVDALTERLQEIQEAGKQSRTKGT